MIFNTACRREVVGGLRLDVQPSHFPPPHYNNPDNPITEAGFRLGKRLFFDPSLSIDSSISCASCHHQQRAFADWEHRRFSLGVGHRLGTRHTPPMFNLQWHSGFMWDGGVVHLDILPLAPLENELEMDISLQMVVERLRQSPSYRDDFRLAFGTEAIDSRLFFFALSQYMRRLVSHQSPYDDYVLGKASLTVEALAGLRLFERYCADCHRPPLFTDFSFRNNGLDAEFSADAGRAHITTFASDSGLFKVPSLRNLAWTAPYFHDGRAQNLDEVLAHYAQGIKASSTLDPRLPQGGFNLSLVEREQIKAFLRSLNDTAFIQNRELSE